jgi:hypothetical protein
MRVVHLVAYFMPEMGYQERYLAELHAEQGHDVHVVTSNRAYPRQRDYRPFGAVYPARRLPSGTTVEGGVRVHRLPALFEANMQVLLRGLIPKIRLL